MSDSRLSQIQKEILVHLSERAEVDSVYYGELKWAVARASNRLTTMPPPHITRSDHWERSQGSKRISDSFLAAFSRSIRNMEEKGLINVVEVNVKFEMNLWEFCRYWIYHGNKLRGVELKEEIFSCIHREQDLFEMKKGYIFFGDLAGVASTRNYSKKIELTDKGWVMAKRLNHASL